MAAFLFFASALGAQAPPYTVVLDPAHGGLETGTLLTAQLQEKTLVLDFSDRLRSVLHARGMRVLLTRDGDTNPDPDARAGAANHARAGACLLLHATASGSGVHLYASSLSPGGPAAGFASWHSAQAPYLTRSLQLASEISTALASAGIPFTLGRTRLAPLDSLQCPAVAVELAPLRITEHGKEEQAPIGEAAYQQRFLNAIAAALVQWRGESDGAGR